MSIRILNGYKTQNNTTFEDLQKKYLELNNSDFYHNVQNLWTRYYLEVYVNCLDDKKSFENYTTARNKTNDLIQKVINLSINYEDTPFDINTKIVFFSYKKRIYCRIFSSVEYIKEYLIKHFELDEYFFANSGDKPIEYSDEEWDNRYDTWNNYEPFFIMNIIHSFNYKIDFYPYISHDVFNKNYDILSKDFRTESLFNRNYENLLINTLELDVFDKSNGDLYEQNLQKLKREFRTKLKNNEYLKEIKKIKSNIFDNLIEINYENFNLL